MTHLSTPIPKSPPFRNKTELTQFGNETSFFGNLNISHELFFQKKTDGLLFSHTDWINNTACLEKRYTTITRYISNKKHRYIAKLIAEEQERVIKSFTKLQQQQFILKQDSYRPQSNLRWDTAKLELTLDDYLKFLTDSTTYNYASILKGIDYAQWKERRDGTKTVSRFLMWRLLAFYKEDILNNIISSTYKLSDCETFLKPFLKRTKLKSFVRSPKKFVELIQYDKTRWNENVVFKLTKTQVIEFTEFYLNIDHNKTNTRTILREIIAHLKILNRTDLIDQLCLRHFRHFSSVIIGAFTKISYEPDIIRFLRQVMTPDGFSAFNDLITKDEIEKYENYIRFSNNVA